MKNRLSFSALIIFLLMIISGCSNNKPEIKWNFPKEEIIGKNLVASDKLDVDIYLDATTSMMGFNSTKPTNFSKLLDDIELVVEDVWKESNPRYFKFGVSVDTLTRQEFIKAKTDPKFYYGPLISQPAELYEAINHIDPKRVSIIISDLFYKGGDVDKVVAGLNNNCIKKGIEIGVLSVTSDFTGVIADCSPWVTVPGETRPLYVLILGGKENIQKVLDAFRDKPYVNADQKFLITKHPLESYEILVVKKNSKDNSAINNDQGSVTKYHEFGNVFGFKLKEKDKDAFLTFELTSNLHPAFPKFSANNLKFEAFKRNAGVKDSAHTDDIEFRNIKVSGNKITGELKILIKEKDELFSYLVNVGFDNTNSLQMPGWVMKYNTETFSQLDHPQCSTWNLKTLLSEVSKYNITSNNPRIGKFYLYIRQ